MNNNNNIFSAYINAMYSAGRLLIYRNEEELSFIREWISRTNTCKIHISVPELKLSGNNIQNCTLCGDVTNRKSGWGSGKNGIMIIMNTPLNINLKEINHLKHDSQDLLNRMISAINLDLKECYVTNLIKCDPDNTVSRPGMMLKNCAPILIKEIEQFKPRIIIIMGDITPVKRIINQYKNIQWYNIDHPVKILKNPELKKSAWTTLKKIRTDLNSI